MNKIITNVRKYEFSDEYEVRYYERGCWQIETRHEELLDAIQRANMLIQEYDYWPDDIQIVRLTYYENILDELPF